MPSAATQCPPVFVLGMHHSMTSIVAKLLIDAGLWPGEARELVMRRDNPLKYFELRSAVVADQNYFDRALAGRRSERGPHAWLGYNLPARVPRDDPLWDEARRIVTDLTRRAHARGSCSVIVKDPRMSLVASPWLDAWRGVGPPICVVLVRDPDETAVRFLDYNTPANPLSAREWFSMWEQYTLRPLAACAERGAVIRTLSYAELSASPAAAVRAVLNSLPGVGLPNRVSNEPFPTDFASKHRTKHQAWDAASQHLRIASDEARAFYRAVGSGGESAIVATVAAAARAVPPWLALQPRRTDQAIVARFDLAPQTQSGRDRVASLGLIRSMMLYDASRPFYAVLAPGTAEIDLVEAGWRIVRASAVAGSGHVDVLRLLPSGAQTALVVSEPGCVAVADWRGLMADDIVAALSQKGLDGSVPRLGPCGVSLMTRNMPASSSAEGVDGVDARGAGSLAATVFVALADPNGLGKLIAGSLVTVGGRTSDLSASSA